MATRIPLVLGSDGRPQQLQSGDTLSTGGGGGGGDMLSILVNSEVSVTTTATLTLATMHVCSGTSSNYTVTLPAASGNAGKLVGVRMADGLTKLVTVKGNGSELINGSNTRIMRNGEVAILKCDGTGWQKVGGVSKPVGCKLTNLPTYFSVNTDGSQKTLGAWQVQVWDDVGGWNGANLYTAPRPGRYRISAGVKWAYDDTTGYGVWREVFVYGGSDSNYSDMQTNNGISIKQSAELITSLAAGDTCYATAAANPYSHTFYVTWDSPTAFFTVEELNPW
jgi:hypothetical protein